MGTFNRLLHPSIRLGYMIVPKYLIDAVEALQEHSHRFVAPSIQVVMNQFIERNYLYQHIKNCLEVSQERQELFVSQFNTCKKMTLHNANFDSLHLVANFNKNISAKEEYLVINRLKEAQITTHSLNKCFIGNQKQQGLILGYSSVRTKVLQRKVQVLVNILNQ